MKIKSVLLILVGLIAYHFVKGQNQKEFYFSFPLNSREAIPSITRQLSIDDIRNDTVWAYANIEQFLKFSREGYNITLLQSPGYAPDVLMSDIGILSPTTTWNYYPTYTAYESLMTQFQTNYPSLCQVTTIATLSSGRKILVAKISDNVATDESEPEFLYTSSMHGDETTGYILMMHLIDYLLSNYGTNSEVTDLVNNMEIFINPLANPDGTYAGGSSTVNGATRGNANGIDLNRNYPDPEDGQHPDGNAWQPETIAFMDFATQHHFVAAANFHGGAEVVNYPWDTWATLHADNNWWQYVSREYADTVHINAISGYMTYLDNGITNGYAWYTISGGRQDYMNYWQHCKEVTIELSDTKLLPAGELEAHWNYNWRSLILYMKEARYGIHGIITDQVTGNPVAAKVFISGHDNNGSEVYSSANLGDYHRLLKAGTYNLQVSATCYQTQTISNVVVTDHNTLNLSIQLVPGGSASVTSAAASAITMTTATSGGNVICDGGNAITARGVCWSTTASPSTANSHTIDGSGTGSFTSSLTGLSSSTLYHVRAYVTNSIGTYYGEDLTFTTTCGTISGFPWTEGFENNGSIPACWTQEQVSSSGINWTFITGSGNNHPAAAHGGTYNATFKDVTAADNKTRLISPPLNLSGLSSPILTFWHTQAVWSGDQDQLAVYYRTSSIGTWTLLTSYTASITSWTQETISLPNGSSDYYIAFEGNAKYGYGVCVDDVSVTGTTTPSLIVTPSNQNVEAASGSTTFIVTSISNWTASSNQTWCTVPPSGSGNGTITANYTANPTAVQRVANITITVSGLDPVVVTVTQNGIVNKTLNLTVFLEGLYEGSGLMHPAMDGSGIHWGESIADIITVELHDAGNYANVVYVASNIFLNTDGTASITLPAGNAGNYYLTVRHRNSIETVSAAPVSFANFAVSYNFDDAGKAFGGNLLQKPGGTWVIYGGDPNQDGIVDASDMVLIDNDAADFVTGYFENDLNGDGLIDSSDMVILDNNASMFVAKALP